MKKFESNTTKPIVGNGNNSNKLGKILEVLPSIVQVLPKIFNKQQNDMTPPPQQIDAYYPTTPTVAQFRASQIRNTMDSIQAHKYLVTTIRNNNVISGNSPLFQQTDTLPNTLRHQHHQD